MRNIAIGERSLAAGDRPEGRENPGNGKLELEADLVDPETLDAA